MAQYFYISPKQCIQARRLLGWSIPDLSDASGVSALAIEQYESGFRKLRSISRQAIAFAFEEQSLVFLQEAPPMRSVELRGICPDPRLSPDIGLLE